MATHFKQENAYGCGLYAIANIFQDKNFITKTRLIESMNGNHTGQLNKWLLEYGKELYLEPFYFDAMGDKLPEWVYKMIPIGEDVFSIPILIDIQNSENSKTHFIAAEITTNGDLIVIDSLKDYSYITTLEQFNNDNFRVFGVWYLRDYYKEGHFMRLNTNNENTNTNNSKMLSSNCEYFNSDECDCGKYCEYGQMEAK